ncbi:MAG: hypothetical protein HY300_15895 [Verrucomicrobia bacterium]|nr:hypothetical protein [Verrucomicrobiota bacterium]
MKSFIPTIALFAALALPIAALAQTDEAQIQRAQAEAASARASAQRSFDETREQFVRAAQVFDADTVQFRVAQAAPPRPAPAPKPPTPGITPELPPPPGGEGGGSSYSTRTTTAKRIMGGGSGVGMGGSVRRPMHTLIVSSKPTDAKFAGEMEEDLNIMSRVFEKETNRETGQEGPDRAMGIWLMASGDSRHPQAMFIEGYGALFLLNTRMPLAPTPAKPAEPKKEQAPDSVWEKTKRELFGPHEPGANSYNVTTMQERFYSGGDEKSRAELKYDEGKVEEFKKSLVEALKNASNIRHLKPEDYITVVVQTGGGAGGPFEMTYHTAGATAGWNVGFGGPGPGTPGAVQVFDPNSRPQQGALRQSTLTLRVKKSDVDEFAGGKLTADEFRKKVATNLN